MSVSSLQRPSFWQHKPTIKKRVAFGSPADGVLQRGDIINKVGNYDSRDIRHQDAQNLFRNAGDNVRVVVQRENPGRYNPSTGSSRSSSRNYSSPLSVSPHLSPRGGNIPAEYSPGGSALTPMYTQPFEVMHEGFYEEIGDVKAPRRRHHNMDVHVVNQPYRTTPLVLPGAKVKPEQNVTECYLRHHPNPAVRGHHIDPDRILKQKVADTVLQRITTDDPSKQVVHKQFNSPIGLYSDANIADTLQRQTGASVGRRNVNYDPSKSATYRALQEEHMGPSDYVQEVSVAPQSRVFTPNKAVPAKKTQNAPGYQAYHQPQMEVNSLGGDESIQQSHSFKRLMWSVLPETDY